MSPPDKGPRPPLSARVPVRVALVAVNIGALAPYLVGTARDWAHGDFGLSAFSMMMPVVAAIAVWIRLRNPPRGPAGGLEAKRWPHAAAALGGTAAALAAGLAAHSLGEPLLGSLSLWLGLWVSAALVFGARVGGLVGLPLFPLVLSAPLTRDAAAVIEEGLQYASAAAGQGWLVVVGESVRREGTLLITEGFRNSVDETCSGVSTISTLLIYTILLGAVLRIRTRPLVVGALLTVPLSVLLNGARIATVSLLGEAGGRALAMGEWHDYTGFAAFFVGYAVLLAALLAWTRRERRSEVRRRASEAAASSGPSQ
jgi:exosortase